MRECCVQNRGLLQYGDTDMIKPLQQSESMVGPCPGWRLGSEGSSGRPHCKGASPAPLSALSAFPSRSDTTTSSGSLSSAPHRHPRRTCDRTAGINTPQRSSKRLALKQAQRDTQGSPASSLTQLHPETELRLEEVLGQPLPGRGGPALPYRLRGQLGDDLGVRQISQEGSLLPGLSNCKGPAPCETQAAYSVLTLDQALDSINPTASLPMGLQNPFEAVAGDSSWQTPSRAEGTEGRDGRASPCSTVTCLQDQLAFRLPLQVCQNVARTHARTHAQALHLELIWY